MTSPTLHAIKSVRKNTVQRPSRAKPKPPSIATGPVCTMFNGNYDGAELQPYQDRPSAIQAQTLPSRRGENLLRWPDGRWTDLHGAPAQPPESHYTAPTFTRPIGMPAAPLRPISTPMLSCYTKGNDAPHSKLTDDLVRQLRQEHFGGATISELARRMGMSKSAMGKAINRETWAHVK